MVWHHDCAWAMTHDSNKELQALNESAACLQGVLPPRAV